MANIRNGNLDLYIKQLLSEVLDSDIKDDHHPPGDAVKNGNNCGPVSNPKNQIMRKSHD